MNVIWFSRNEARFHNKRINWKTAISLITANTSLSGNNTKKASNNSIRDFSILKIFKVNIHHPKAPSIIEIIWQAPIFNWIKCNTDGVSSGNPDNSSCGVIFRDSDGNCVGCFSDPLGNGTSYLAEIKGVLRAIELAHEKGWNNLWIEKDSSLVVQAFKYKREIPWNVRNRWNNAQYTIRNMNCIVTHTYI